MNDWQTKIPQLAGLSGLPIYGDYGPRLSWKYPCLSTKRHGEYVLRYDAYNAEKFNPLGNLNHAWLVAQAWCKRHNGWGSVTLNEDDLSRAYIGFPNTGQDKSWEVASIIRKFEHTDPATALSEVVLLAEEARKKS